MRVRDAPAGLEAAPGFVPPEVRRVRSQTAIVGVLVAFHTTFAGLRAAFPGLSRRVGADGAPWIAWPKRVSGVLTGLTDDRLREDGLPTGMADNKVCAIAG